MDQYVFGVQQPGVQNQPRVAMSPDGTFVITWTSSPIYYNLSNTNARESAIFAREYDNADVPLGNEFQSHALFVKRQYLFARPAMDANDNFVVVWEGDIQNSSTWGVYGDYFTAQGGSSTTLPTTWTPTGPKLLNNTPNTRGSFTGVTTVDLHDSGPQVAMDPSTSGGGPAGFVVTWANFTGASTGYDVFAQQFAAGGAANGGAFLVNQTTASWQLMPAIGIDSQGDITVVWTSYGQDNASNGKPGVLDYGIYARIYYITGTNTGEFRVNATTLGDQVAPAVASDNFENDSLIAWVGPDTRAAGTTAIFDRIVDPPTTAIVSPPTNVLPAVTASPGSASVSAGQSVTFTAAAKGTPMPTVQWQVSTNGGSSFTNIAGATSTSYTFTATAGASGYQYHAVFSNSVGSATSKAATLTVAVVPSFALTGPGSGSFTAGQTVTFQWTAANVDAGSTISLAYDTTTNWGNPKWIEINGVTGANGAGSYSWNTSGVTPGTYYLAGYLYDSSKQYLSHLGSAITIAAATVAPVPSFTLTGPTSGSITAGQMVTFQWTAANVDPGSTISLAYDTTTNWGNPKWIEVNAVTRPTAPGRIAGIPAASRRVRTIWPVTCMIRASNTSPTSDRRSPSRRPSPLFRASR